MNTKSRNETVMTERAPIDRSKWNKPTYQGHYDDRALFYEGIRCQCRKCEKSFVFGELEQKEAFEVSKKYPGWQPSLCSMCHSQFLDTVAKEAAYSQHWETERQIITQPKEFLKDWLYCAVEADSYRKHGFEHKIGMIKKLIAEQ